METQSLSENEAIAAVRRFSRFYTGRLKLLDTKLLKTEFSLTEGRVLYELAHREGLTAADLVKELGLDENTIVMYSSDNGAETFTWPDGGTTMFRGEKNTQWEGGYRVPTLIKWPGVVKPGTVVNDIGAHEDMLTTLVAAAGDKTAKADLLKGRSIAGKSYKVHLDGYDLGPALKGEAAWPRKEFIYWTDDGSVAALRYENIKVTFLEQEAEGLHVWQKPFTELRAPKLTNLRMDPFERAEHENAMGYQRWYLEHMFMIAPAGAYVGQWLQSFREFPPRQKPGSFNLERVMEAVTAGSKQ